MRLSEAQHELLESARRAVLATIRDDGSPRLVPCAFAARQSESELVLYSAVDEKPKSVADPRDLGRVRDIVRRPRAAVLVDRWSEDWTELAWLRLDGVARLIEPDDPAEHDRAIAALRDRYPQYAEHRLETRPVIRIRVERIAGWSATPSAG